MFEKFLSFHELKKILVKYSKKLNEDRFTEKCMKWKDRYEGVFKSIQLSEIAKANGNKLYGRKDLNFTQLYEILILFNESIALAPTGSKELATAYANKSAVLLRMRKYQECIVEIDKSLKITQSTTLRIKLLCRKAECLTALGSSDNRSCLERAKFAMSRLENLDGEKEVLNKLIEKTQSKIDRDKLDVPKEEKKIERALKMFEAVERRNLSESIRVEYSEKYGRHLIAAREFEPGEIILVEKSYFNDLDDRKAYHYCNRCFNHLWTAVPCDHCYRHLYCSEQCKIDAWNEYHELECFALSNMMYQPSVRPDQHISLHIGIFCRVLKEAGSIEQLLADLESSDRCGDLADGDALFKEDLNNYKNIFSVPVVGIQKKKALEYCAERAVTALIGLAKYTKILGKTYDTIEIKNLMEDDAAILVGALLLKFAIILRVGCPSVLLVDPIENVEDEKDYLNAGYFSAAIPLLSMHTVSGCIPNVDSLYTYGNRYILCAIKPIKAGDKLVVYSKSQSIWAKSPKSVRQLTHRMRYYCPCECQACKENWSNDSFDATKFQDLDNDGAHCSAALTLWNEKESILCDCEAVWHKASFPDAKILSRTKELVAAAWKQLSMPSPVIHQAVMLLIRMLATFYDPLEIYRKVPHLSTIKIQAIHDSLDL